MMERPHAVIIPFPGSGHINPHLQLAKILHSNGFYITYINTEYVHQCILKSRGPNALQGSDDFRFETFPDGLLPSDRDSPDYWNRMAVSLIKNTPAPIRELFLKLNSSPGVPPISCIIPNGLMGFTLDISNKLAIPSVVFWTTSACGFMGYLHLDVLLHKGLIPPKDENFLTNGYLDTPIDWIPGMKDLRLGDLASFLRSINPDNINLHFDKEQANNSFKAGGIIFNTIDCMEKDVLIALKAMYPLLYTLGPLQAFTNLMSENHWIKPLRLSVYKEEFSCREWLDRQRIGSVVYVNFGGVIVLNAQQLDELAWGLAESKQPFLWVIRPDMVEGGLSGLAEDFVKETRDRCLLASWCNQEDVIAHSAIGGFVTHCGWNSTMESVCNGLPMVCCPGFAEQYTNCKYLCKDWGLGMEMKGDMKREEVKRMVRELMEGEKGREMRLNASKWKARVEKATREGGSSYKDLERFVNDFSLRRMPKEIHGSV